MQMEFDDCEVKSDLYALKQLYGLLHIIGCDIMNLQHVRKLLDKRAIQLLKRLLDDARQRLISKGTHSNQMKSDRQLGLFNMQTSTTTKSKLPISPQISTKAFPISTNFQTSTSFEQTSEQLPKVLPLITKHKAIHDDQKISTDHHTLDESSEPDYYSSFSNEVGKAIEQIDAHILSVQDKNFRLNYVEKAEFESMESPSQPMISYVQGFRIPINCSNTKTVISTNNNSTFDHNYANPISSKSHHGSEIKQPHRHEIIVGPTLLDQQYERKRRRNGSQYYSISEPDNDSVLSESESVSTEADSENISPSAEEEESDGNSIINDDDNSSYYSIAQTSHSDEVKSHAPLPRISRLRRIKNKLWLIFHHHHHHHDRSGKVVQRMFQHGNNKRSSYKHRIHGNAVVKGRSRSTAVVVKRGGANRFKRGGGDVGNFRELVGGLMRHVGGGGGARKKPAALRKGVHIGGGAKRRAGWWRGGGVKMGSHRRKGRVKVGFNQPLKLKL